MKGQGLLLSGATLNYSGFVNGRFPENIIFNNAFYKVHTDQNEMKNK